MMSHESIRALSREAAEAAADEGRVPFTVGREDLEDWRSVLDSGKAPRLPFPNLGDYRPEGYELVDWHFVDKTGFDLWDAGGPALSVGELITEKLLAGRAYAIIREGQFQLYLGEFRKIDILTLFDVSIFSPDDGNEVNAVATDEDGNVWRAYFGNPGVWESEAGAQVSADYVTLTDR